MSDEQSMDAGREHVARRFNTLRLATTLPASPWHAVSALESQVQGLLGRRTLEPPHEWDVEDEDRRFFNSILQWLDEDSLYQLEGLLGLAFVAAQRDIGAVTNAFGKLVELRAKLGLGPFAVGSSREVLLARSRQVEVLNAAANYFKHADEWPLAWQDDAPRQARATIRILNAVSGVSDCVTGENIRVLALDLGITDFRNLSPILACLASWCADVRKVVGQQLADEGYLPSDWDRE